MPKPDDNEYYVDDRTEHVAQGDVFRGVPFSSPDGSGVGFSGFGMLLHYTSNMMDGPPGTPGYAHHFRLVAPIFPFPMLQELGLSEEQLVSMRNGDKMGRYLYLPAYPDEFPESGVVLYRPELVRQVDLDGRRVTQLQKPAAQQLQRRLARVFFGREMEDPDPDMTDHWNPPEEPA
jgi:hypothetical protein